MHALENARQPSVLEMVKWLTGDCWWGNEKGKWQFETCKWKEGEWDYVLMRYCDNEGIMITIRFANEDRFGQPENYFILKE